MSFLNGLGSKFNVFFCVYCNFRRKRNVLMKTTVFLKVELNIGWLVHNVLTLVHNKNI